MPELFIVEAYNELDNDSSVVGVYSSFDRAVDGADAHRAWFLRESDEYYITPTLLNANLTKDVLRFSPFHLSKGCVPKYYWRGSAHQERFMEGTDES